MKLTVKSPFFMAQRVGRWQLHWLILGLIVSAVGALAAAAGLLANGTTVYLAFEEMSSDFASQLELSLGDDIGTAPLTVLATLLLVGIPFWGAAIAGTLTQGRSVNSLVTPVRSFRWSFVGKTLMLEIVLWVLGAVVGLALPGAADVVFAGFGWRHVVWAFPLALALLIQTSGEDAFFKGYLLRQIGAVTKVAWFAPMVTTAIFVSLHLGNADLDENLLLLLPLFVMSELIIISVILRTAGMEAAYLLHFTNNAALFFLMGEANTQANDLTLFVVEELEGDAARSQDQAGFVVYVAYLAILFAGLTWRKSPFYLETHEWSETETSARLDPTSEPVQV